MEKVNKWDAKIAVVGDWVSFSSYSLHDSIKIELLGIPSFRIINSKFVSEMEMMSQALGAKNYPFVIISHTIISATIDELKLQAAKASEEVINLIFKSESSNKS